MCTYTVVTHFNLDTITASYHRGATTASAAAAGAAISSSQWQSAKSKTSLVMDKLQRKKQFQQAVLEALAQQHIETGMGELFQKIKFSNARMIHSNERAVAHLGAGAGAGR